jgi:hypothetical protein
MVSGYVIFICFILGAFDMVIYMVWHGSLAMVNMKFLGGTFGKQCGHRFQWFGINDMVKCISDCWLSCTSKLNE